MNRSWLLYLPSDLHEIIACYVCKNSVTDLFNFMLTCKTLGDVSCRASVYAAVDVFTTPLQRWQQSQEFMRRCYEYGNRSALYLKGAHCFFLYDRPEEGLMIIKMSADRGYPIAIYTYAMLSKVLFDDGTFLTSLTKKSVRKMSSYIRDNGWGWEVMLPSFNKKKAEFFNSALPSLYYCPCTPYRVWYHWYDDGVKSLDMCDACFWVREIAMFYKFLGVNYGPDTRDW